MTLAADARFWDRAARKYARSSIADMDGYERSLARTRALLPPKARVLELGCGTASTALRLADAASCYLATDISPEMIEIATEKLTATPVPSLRLRCATAETLAPVETGFDAVLGFNYLHLVRDLQSCLDEVHARLVPGGLFISKTPCLAEMNPLIGRVMVPVMRMLGKAPHVSSLRCAALTAAMEDAGFAIVSVERHASKGRDTRPYIVARRL